MVEIKRQSWGRVRKGFILLAGLLLVFQLACMTVDLGVKIVPEGPDSGRIEFMVAYRMTEKYVEEAKKANQELAADYAGAGIEPPEDSFFPESFDDFDEKPDLSDIPGDNFQLIKDTPTEMIATNTARYGPNEEPIEDFQLRVEQDENGWSHYILEITLPEYGDEEFITAMDEMQNQELGPKPPVIPPETEPSEGDGGMMGWMGIFEELSEEAEQQVSLEAWYAQRVLMNSGLPEYTYTIQMPGQIQSHTVENQATGSVGEDGTTFLYTINNDYYDAFGPGEHTLILESVAHPCAAECATGPHWIWDEASDADNCGCICEMDWQPNENGDCVSCDDYCSGLDPRAVGDPADTFPNSCGCRCDATLMEWDPEGECVCMVGAEPAGDGCGCKEGWTLSEDKTNCIPAGEPTPEGTVTPTGCQTDQGMNCAKNPELCNCPPPQVCDLWSQYKNTAGCSPPVAVYMVSPDVSSYERWWISGKMTKIRQFYRSQGYQVQVVTIKTGDEVADALGNPSTKALAYFGHARTPTIEDSNAGSVKSAVHLSLVKRYREMGYNMQKANELANARSEQPNLDYVYMHTCHSLDDNSMRDYLTKPGGTYWGKQGLLWAFQDPTKTTRPAQ